ncbi:MAG: RNA polymerase sigma factor [Sphingomonas sp.]|uniref:RNA polymerase sigma factor n=1 Tax=Sphingomonas sp. TaxID=28214 RepID=UPI001ACA4957|nr:RNA polymerase sigma factor [Sphingomonas sp.]MBN8808937.1 RNA polymerase sigma factor [Sphingomonas sp.]
MTDAGLRAIFLEQRPMLLRLVTARLGNRDDAEDVLQDMFFKIDSLATQPIAQPAAFLYRVASNLATDRRIAEGRRGARDSAWLDVQSTADELPDAERAAIARSELRVVEGAIDDMPERMATALRLFRVEGRAQRDIAADLGITVSGVEKLLRRAYKQIHDRLSENGAGPAKLNRLSDERGT